MSRRIPPHLLAAKAAPLLTPEWDEGVYDDILDALRLHGTTNAARDWDALIPARFINDLPPSRAAIVQEPIVPTVVPSAPPPRERITSAELVDGWAPPRVLRLRRAYEWNNGFHRDILRNLVGLEAGELCPDDARPVQIRIQPTDDPKAYRWLARYELRSV